MQWEMKSGTTVNGVGLVYLPNDSDIMMDRS